MKIKNLVFQIKDVTFDQALEYLVDKAQNKRVKTFVVTINPEIIMLAKEDKHYEKVLKSADLALCDGVGIIFAGKLFGKSFPGRVRGVDLLEKLSDLASQRSLTVGLLGGGKNVALETSKCLKKKYPKLKISFAKQEWVNQKTNVKKQKSDRTSHGSKLKCDILFVAFGSPKQEKWIYENLSKLDVKVAIGVGGAFDFVSGKVRRAPLQVRRIGLEWLFRLIIQPWRIKRQIVLPKFVLLVIRERFF